MISLRSQEARRLHPLSAEEIGEIVREVTGAVLGIVRDEMARLHTPARSTATGRRPPYSADDAACSRVKAIIAAAAEVTEIPVADLLGHRRMRSLVWPRQMAMLVAVEDVLGASLPQIGRAFDRDHTTIMHGAAAARKRVDAIPEQKALYEAIKAKVIS